MRARQFLVAAVVVVLVVGIVPGALPGGVAFSSDGPADATPAGTDTQQASAPVGQQLATVIEVTDDEVKGEIEAIAFETDFESATESERATLLADRAATLRERTDRLTATQANATTSYRAGELSTVEYARELALLNARSTALLTAFERLDERAEDVPERELQAAGYDRAANEAAAEQLTRLTGAGATALLKQYTGERAGEFSVDVDDGLSIEVENDDGERSREFEREQPGDGALVVDRSDALASARNALTADRDGEWLLTAAETDSDDGVYAFEFAFRGAGYTGEAEVGVDGETGQVFTLEEELEPREDDGDDDLLIAVVEGTPAPGATVTLQVGAAGEPLADATVEIGDTAAGTTDANGELTVTLPTDDEVEITVEHGDREGELEFEFDDEEENGEGEEEDDDSEKESDEDDNEDDGDESDGEQEGDDG
ncbi:MAG: hypothetical protein V5A25_02080 [Halovenus sp.]